MQARRDCWHARRKSERGGGRGGGRGVAGSQCWELPVAACAAWRLAGQWIAAAAGEQRAAAAG